MSLIVEADADADLSARAARSLLRARVDTIEQIGGGRNSRVYRLETSAGTFALKRYPPRGVDGRDRLGTEQAALKLMERHGFRCVPRVVAAAPEENLVILSWIHGSLVTTAVSADIDQAVAFLRDLHALRTTVEFGHDRLAAEACLSGAEIKRQIEGRLVRLRELSPREPMLADFLESEFQPEFERLVGRMRKRLSARSIDFEGLLPQEMRTLVPSDFGFHNSLRQPDGTLNFIDFEYFGWDDPVKLVSDVLLHPGTTVESDLQARFRTAAEKLYGADPGFSCRFDAFYFLFAMRWALILLNEFLPHRWRQRVLAGAGADWSAAKSRQLSRARSLIGVVNQHVER